MRSIDLRAPIRMAPDQDDRGYAMVFPEGVFTFRHGDGNKEPWDQIEQFLAARLASSPHAFVGDLCISVEGAPEITVSEDLYSAPERFDHIADALMSSGVCGPCTPVTVAHREGTWSHVGMLSSVRAPEHSVPSLGR